MFDKLDCIEEKYQELSGKVADPAIIADQKTFQKFMKEMSELEPVVKAYEGYRKMQADLADAREMIELEDDEDVKEMAKEEARDLEQKLEKAQDDLKVLLLPKDPNDDKNVIVEIRAGTGGEEAALFANDLLRMYLRYAERHRWKSEIIEISDTGIGGIKEAVVMIKGKGAYSRLKFESGVHRVQRVPETESSGRIHTSAATVAVLPEVDDIEVEINPNDLKIDVFRASGNGGQCVNTTDSAVRITHQPSGIVVTCQDEKDQIMNKEKAMRVLKSRLYDKMVQEQNDKISADRRSQIGSGDRSERIRTYNFPQGRVTDHRINLTLYKLDQFLDGDIEEAVDGLITADQAEKMKDFG